MKIFFICHSLAIKAVVRKCETTYVALMQNESQEETIETTESASCFSCRCIYIFFQTPSHILINKRIGWQRNGLSREFYLRIARHPPMPYHSVPHLCVYSHKP